MRTPTEEELRTRTPATMNFGHGTTSWEQGRTTARGWRRHNDGTRSRVRTRWFWVLEDGAVTARGVPVVEGDRDWPAP